MRPTGEEPRSTVFPGGNSSLAHAVRRFAGSLLRWVIASLLWVKAKWYWVEAKFLSIDPTSEFIDALDLDAIRHRGNSFASVCFDPARLGIPKETINYTYDFDFDSIDRLKKRFRNVCRYEVLQAVAKKICAGCNTDTERHLAILQFCQEVGFHGPLQAMIRKWIGRSELVTDPLILMLVNEMRCGQVARLACDLATACGIESRCVSLDGHVIGELFYDGAWHYLDADSAGAGLCVRMSDGSIPSVRRLSENPSLLDSVPAYFDLTYPGRPISGAAPSRSHAYFGGEKNEANLYYFKRSHPLRRRDPVTWSWTDLEMEKPDWIIAPDLPFRHTPGMAFFESVDLGDESVRIQWRHGAVPEDSPVRYEIHVNSKPRGFRYSTFYGSEEARSYWDDAGWVPEMYSALYTPVEGDLLVLSTAETSIELPRQERVTYVTVVARDRYHESVGRVLFYSSNELRIPARAD